MNRRSILKLLGLSTMFPMLAREAVAAIEPTEQLGFDNTLSTDMVSVLRYPYQREFVRQLGCYDQQAGRADREGVVRRINYIEIRDADLTTKQMRRLKEELQNSIVKRRRTPCK